MARDKVWMGLVNLLRGDQVKKRVDAALVDAEKLKTRLQFAPGVGARSVFSFASFDS
jgi:hypothetical protein